jgi:hypothetical protein
VIVPDTLEAEASANASIVAIIGLFAKVFICEVEMVEICGVWMEEWSQF